MPCSLAQDGGRDNVPIMRDLLLLAVHLLVSLAKLLRPGGARAVSAESLLLKHQLLISNHCRQRAPNLTTLDRFALALTTLFVRPLYSAIIRAAPTSAVTTAFAFLAAALSQHL